MTDENIILPEDERAAHQGILVPRVPGAFKGSCLWVSRHGAVFHDEATARWHGSTHIKCFGCGSHFEKNSFCHPCSERKQDERHAARPARDWDGETICHEAGDTYVESYDELWEMMYDAPSILDDRWVFAEPAKPRAFIDIDDLVSNEMPEGFEFSQEAYEIADKLNAMMAEELAGTLWPGETRVTFDAFRAWIAEQQEEVDE